MSPPDEQWAMLILSDESRFNLFTNDGRVGVWRTHSERSFTEVKPRKKHYPIRHGLGMHRWVVTLHVRGQCIVIVTINPLLAKLYNLIFTHLCLATAIHNSKWAKITHICLFLDQKSAFFYF